MAGILPTALGEVRDNTGEFVAGPSGGHTFAATGSGDEAVPLKCTAHGESIATTGREVNSAAGVTGMWLSLEPCKVLSLSEAGFPAMVASKDSTQLLEEADSGFSLHRPAGTRRPFNAAVAACGRRDQYPSTSSTQFEDTVLTSSKLVPRDILF